MTEPYKPKTFAERMGYYVVGPVLVLCALGIVLVTIIKGVLN